MSTNLHTFARRSLLADVAFALLVIASAIGTTLVPQGGSPEIALAPATPAQAQPSSTEDPTQLLKDLGAFPLTPSKVLTGCTTAGGTTTCNYTIEFQNNYPALGTYTGPITFSDSVYPATALTASTSSSGWTCTSGVTVTCSIASASVPVNGSVSLSLSISFPAAPTPAPDFNCVKVDIPVSPDSDCADVTNAGPPYDLDVAKALVGGSGNDEAALGSPVHFEVKVQNKGGVPANSKLVLIDEVPAGFTVTHLVHSSFWSCSPTSGTGPLTITCTHQTTTAIPPPTTVTPFTYFPTIEVHGHTNKTGLFVNCATPYVEGGKDITPDYFRHCANVMTRPGEDTFNKQALDKDGNPITGPVAVGDTITYVLSYNANTSGPLMITDTLSPNQSFAGWAPSAPAAPWTYSPAIPYSVGNATTYTRGATASGQSFTMDIPVGGGSANQGSVGAGDGFAPIPVGSRIYGVNHHGRSTSSGGGDANINCWNASDLSLCWPSKPLGIGTNIRMTPNLPHAAVVNSRIYYPSARYQYAAGSQSTVQSTVFGMGCWDTTTDAACSFVDLPGTPAVTGDAYASDSFYSVNRYVAGVRHFPNSTGRLLVFALDRLYCMDVSGISPVACSGWSPAVLPGPSVSNTDVLVESGASPTRAFVLYHAASESSPYIKCYDLSSGALCGGWTAATAGALTGARAWSLSPYLNATSGGTDAVCAHFWGGGAPRCLNAATASAFTPSATFTSMLQNKRMWEAFRIPGTSKVLYPHDFNAQPDCFDFTTSAACTGFTPYWTANTTQDYGYTADPSNPDCLLELGHRNVLLRFAPDTSKTSSSCAQTPTLEKKFSLDGLFCAIKPKTVTWTKITIESPPSQLTGGTIKIFDKNGSPVPGVSPIALAAGDVDYDLNISALGNTSEIKVVFEPTYSGATTAAYKLRVHYTSDVDPQICYKTTVQACGEDVTNTAVFESGGKRTEKTVNLGKATGPECENCLELDTKVRLLPNGRAVLTLTQTAPASFMSNIMEVRPLTPGVSVFPPLQPSTGTTNWTIVGAAPGDTVKLQIEGVKRGAGSVGNGDVDQCCNAEIEIKIPKEPKEEIEKFDIKLDKKGWQQAGPHHWYEFNVTNVGAAISNANGIVVTDTLPPGVGIVTTTAPDWTCTTTGSVPTGLTFTCTYAGSASLAPGASLPPIKLFVMYGGGPKPPRNCASADFGPTTGLTDANLDNNKDCVEISVTPVSRNVDFAIEKSVNPKNGPVPNMFSFGLRTQNVGTTALNAPATITVTDVVPAGMTFVSSAGTNWSCGPTFPLASGATLTCTYTGSMPVAAGALLPAIEITAVAPAAPNVRNCGRIAIASATQSDTNSSNNQDCVEVKNELPLRNVDLTLEKTANPIIGPIPNMSEFTLRVRNAGAAALTSPATVTVTDVVPAGMTFMSATGANWNCGTGFPKAAGATLTCTYTGALPLAPGAALPPIKITAAAPGTKRAIRNCGTVAVASPTQRDSNSGNNRGCTETESNTTTNDDEPDADFSLEKSAKPVDGPLPNMFEFTLRARNGGPAYLTAPATITISDVVPAGMRFLSASGTNWNCGTGYPRLAGQTMNCTYTGVIDVAPGNLPPVKIIAVAEGAGAARIKNCGIVRIVSSDQPDTRRANNEDCVTVDVKPRETTPKGDECRPPEHWDGQRCVRCEDGERWNENRKRCEPTAESCKEPEHWNGRRCVRCARDEQWDERLRACRRAEPERLVCDQRTTNVTAAGCVCRYPNMLQLAPTSCACPANTELQPGIGCVPTCQEPMTLNREKLVCECPKGTTLKNGKCEKEKRDFDLRFNIGPRFPSGPSKPESGPVPARPDGRP